MTDQLEWHSIRASVHLLYSLIDTSHLNTPDYYILLPEESIKMIMDLSFLFFACVCFLAFILSFVLFPSCVPPVVSGLSSSKISACSMLIKNSAEARLGGMIEQSLLNQT